VRKQANVGLYGLYFDCVRLDQGTCRPVLYFRNFDQKCSLRGVVVLKPLMLWLRAVGVLRSNWRWTPRRLSCGTYDAVVTADTHWAASQCYELQRAVRVATAPALYLQYPVRISDTGPAILTSGFHYFLPLLQHC
jgi:hypothetical protein